jgi:hypothetical protein
MPAMTKVTLACQVPGCIYRRELDLPQAKIEEMYQTNGVVVCIDTTEETLHHLNNFADHGYNHGMFKVRTEGHHEGLLEVTHDFESRPIFHPSGERK